MVDTLTLAIPLSTVTAKEYLIHCLHFTTEEADGYLLSLLNSKEYARTPAMKYKLSAYRQRILRQRPLHNIRLWFNHYTSELYIIFHVSAFEFQWCGQKEATPSTLFCGNYEDVGNFIMTTYWSCMELFRGINASNDEYVIEEVAKVSNINNMYILRIDYSFNLRVPPALVKLYLHMFNDSVLEKRRFVRRNKYKHNCMRVTNKSVTVIMYDKLAETEARHPEYAEEARGILRFEVQVRKGKKIRELKDTAGGKNQDLLERSFALLVLLKYWQLLLPEGDFYKQNALIKKLDELTARQRNKIIRFLKFIQSKHSVATARAASSHQTFDKNIATLSALGIAPYCVPIHKCRDYGINQNKLGPRLENPYTQIA